MMCICKAPLKSNRKCAGLFAATVETSSMGTNAHLDKSCEPVGYPLVHNDLGLAIWEIGGSEKRRVMRQNNEEEMK